MILFFLSNPLNKVKTLSFCLYDFKYILQLNVTFFIDCLHCSTLWSPIWYQNLLSHFLGATVTHIRYTGNKTVHSLAWYALRRNNKCIWLRTLSNRLCYRTGLILLITDDFYSKKIKIYCTPQLTKLFKLTSLETKIHHW